MFNLNIARIDPGPGTMDVPIESRGLAVWFKDMRMVWWRDGAVLARGSVRGSLSVAEKAALTHGASIVRYGAWLGPVCS